MDDLRHEAAARRAGEIREDVTYLRRTMRHDAPFQLIANETENTLGQLERRAEQLIDGTVEAVDEDELRRRAAAGDGEALPELCRRTAEPAAA